MPAMYYGRVAYEGFAKAMGHKMGLTVNIQAGNNACINGNGVITLPDMDKFQTPDEFNETCGTVIHEMAHQFYGSHSQYAAMAKTKSRLWMDCLNTVLDVADETWIGRWFIATHGNGRPAWLLEHANVCVRSRDNGGSQWHLKGDGRDAWRIQCLGILKARLGLKLRRKHTSRAVIAQAQAVGVDAAKCWKIIAGAKPISGQKFYHDGVRNWKFWSAMFRRADELEKELLPLAPPPGAAPNPGGVGEAAGKGRGSVPAGAVEATEGDGKAQAGMPAPAANGTPGGSTGGKGKGGSGGQRMSHQEARDLLLPTVRRVADRIALDGDSLDLLDGLASGSVIGQVHRFYTDGKCMARWQDNEHSTGMAVAVLLDCSGSMRSILPACSGIARAFAEGMRDCAEVCCFKFGDFCSFSQDFQMCEDMGGTQTANAMQTAGKWLHPKNAGAKWMVVITDGQPDDPQATARITQSAIACGMKVLCIGIGPDTDKFCRDSMPGAKVVAAADPIHLAIELDAAASMIANP